MKWGSSTQKLKNQKYMMWSVAVEMICMRSGQWSDPIDYKWGMVVWCIFFQPWIIYHIPVKPLKNYVINTPLFRSCEFMTTKTNVPKAIVFNDRFKIHTFKHVIWHRSKFFIHRSYNFEISYSRPRIGSYCGFLLYFIPKRSAEVIFSSCINKSSSKLVL